MPNLDISRHLNQPAKHYSGSRLQQGRPILDSDFNERAEAYDHQLREALLDVVGPTGSPDFGFLPNLKVGDIVNAKLVQFGAFTQAMVLDYTLRSGVLWAGGERWEQPTAESVLFQREFLQMGAATAPRAAIGEQRHLSYLRGWRQPVTAIEDGELLEPSLGGADTACRVRRIRHVEVRKVQAVDCHDGFEEVLEELGNGDTATYDPATCELRSNTRLQMTFQSSSAGECGACEPSLEGRYLGGESHAIRIMLTGPNHYVWAVDNAAPPYRVRLVLDGGGGARVDMLTPPKDMYHYPRQNTVVEFLPWEALLENGTPAGGKVAGENVKNEKVAAPVGFFADADGPYDPVARSFHVRLAPGNALQLGVGKGKAESNAEAKAIANLKSGQGPIQDGIALRWDEQHPLDDQLNPSESSADGFVTYVYMRVWHLKQPDASLTIPTSSTEPLGNTGLVPVFTGKGRPGDFWTVAVRPEAPDEILPLDIMREGGLPPQGPREIVTPICLVTWNSLTGGAHEVIAIEDCRPGLPALTDHGCCTYDVGPGGDFESIQAAVNALPTSGGRICVRPGVYREEIHIAGRSNVVLSGCAGRTQIITPENPAGDALVTIELEEDERNISVRNVTIEGRGQVGIRGTGGSRIEITGVTLLATARGDVTLRSAIETTGAQDVRITRCHVRMGGAFSHHAAVYVDCPAYALIEGNTIETQTDANGSSFAWGGIQVAGGSNGIEVRDNVIRGGRGHGITLGSVIYRALNGSNLGLQGAGAGQSNDQAPFALTGILRTFVDASDVEFFPEPQPAIDNLLIFDNQIDSAGGSGISSLALEVEHDRRATGPPLCFRRTTFPVINLTISDNRITGNARQPAQNTGDRFAVGGIVLSEANRATVRGNLIEGNGVNFPVPICGICVARGEHVSLVSNRVRGNGPLRSTASANAIARFRGGIVLAAPAQPDAPMSSANGPRNIVVRRNMVDQPNAPAAFIFSLGACRIMNNHLHSNTTAGALALPPVVVFSFGKPFEAVDIPAGEPNPARWRQPEGSRQYLNGRAQQLPDGDGGTLVFNGNQVTTNGAQTVSGAAFGAWLISSDHVCAAGNSFAARHQPRPVERLTPVPHALIVGLTSIVTTNRVAETLEATTISLAAMAPMMIAVAGNQLTHCPAIFGCANHGNPEYFIQEDNLVWFRPAEGRCEVPAQPIIAILRGLCASLFGPTVTTMPPIFTTLPGNQP
jgi:hypothetical protein